MRLRSLLLSACALLLACAAEPPRRGVLRAYDPADPEFGEIRPFLNGALLHGNIVRFDGNRVTGPAVLMERFDDGSWRGSLCGRTAVLDVTGARFHGPDVDFRYSRDGAILDAGGLAFGARIRLRVEKDTISYAHFGTLLGERKADGQYALSPVDQMLLLGAARLPQPPMPQMLFALESVAGCKPSGMPTPADLPPGLR